MMRIIGRSLITLGGVVVVWMGVTMLLGGALIRPSATEKYLEQDEAKIEISTNREDHPALWFMGHAMRIGSGGLLLAFGALLVVKPWRQTSVRTQPAAQTEIQTSTTETRHD